MSDNSTQMSFRIEVGERRFGRINWLGLQTLAGREIKRFLVVWTQTLLAPLVTAGLFLMIFTIAIGPQRGDVMGVPFTTFIAPGILMMTVIQNAFANTSSSIVISKVQGNIVDTLMPPLSGGELVLGYLGGAIARGALVALGIGLGMVLFLGLVLSTSAGGAGLCGAGRGLPWRAGYRRRGVRREVRPDGRNH